MKRLLLIIFLAYMFNGCSPTKEHSRFKFAKKGYTLQQPTALRTDGVYVYSSKDYYGKDYYTFIRFFENGRCFISNLINGEINNDSLMSVNKTLGQRTFYKNDGNKITYEEWGGYYTRYCYAYAVVDNEKFIETAFKPRSFTASVEKLPQQSIYLFKPLLLTTKADW